MPFKFPTYIDAVKKLTCNKDWTEHTYHEKICAQNFKYLELIDQMNLLFVLLLRSKNQTWILE